MSKLQGWMLTIVVFINTLALFSERRDIRRITNHIEWYEKENLIEEDTMDFDIPPPIEDSEAIKQTKNIRYGYH